MLRRQDRRTAPAVLSVCVHGAGPSQTAAGQGLEAVRRVGDEVDARVRALLAELVGA
jgi:hypothetical protein